MESGEHRGESKIEPFTLYQVAHTSFSVTIEAKILTLPRLAKPTQPPDPGTLVVSTSNVRKNATYIIFT